MACQFGVDSPESRSGLPRDHFGGSSQERWLSGRKRRFAKSVNWETGSAGSNPVRSAFEFLESKAVVSVLPLAVTVTQRGRSSVGRATDF